MEDKILKPEIEHNERTLANAHRDIEFGNSYRIEYIKHLISIATGVIIFSVTFMKDVINKDSSTATGKVVLLAGWFCLLLSIFVGILQMRYWAWYYTSWGTRWKDSDAAEWRDKIMKKRRIAEFIQIFGFTVGLTLLTIFAAINLY